MRQTYAHFDLAQARADLQATFNEARARVNTPEAEAFLDVQEITQELGVQAAIVGCRLINNGTRFTDACKAIGNVMGTIVYSTAQQAGSHNADLGVKLIMEQFTTSLASAMTGQAYEGALLKETPIKPMKAGRA